MHAAHLFPKKCSTDFQHNGLPGQPSTGGLSSKAYGTSIEFRLLRGMCPDFVYFCRRRHHPRHPKPKHEVKVRYLDLVRSLPQHLHFNIVQILYQYISKMIKVCVQFPGQKT